MDLRTERTLQWIEQAFIDGVLKEGFDKVTVSQIATAANISRKTFYAHYLDKYDLAEKLADILLTQYATSLNERLTNQDADLQDMVDMLIGDEHEGRLLRALLTIHTEAFDFEHRFGSLLSDRIRAYWHTDDELEQEILVSYALTTIRHYSGSGETFSRERQHRIVQRLANMF
jgi:AcrR family transcriptional regulator